MAFHIFDAPGHGKDICPTGGDSYPGGSPDGHKIQDQMAEFARKKINFTAVKVNEQCNAMIKVMQDSYASVGGAKMILNDLSHACQTKSAAEVTKDFIKESSYILRAAIGGPGAAAGGKGKAAAAVKKAKPGPALWDTK